MEKLIITAALTGNVPTREMTPHVPLTPDEIAADVR
ncbi:MAG: 3-keto-5-aminohexanoate cleavage protein, partial [Desulfobacterales bacterium]|nr:3-keto-5-aminohexanoate cleavage protein [Desulfobacterales bacterium]